MTQKSQFTSHSFRAIFARRLAHPVLFCAFALSAASCGDSASYLPLLDMAGGDGGSGNSGLPCDVSQVLQNSCISCHGSPPSGAPISLSSYADLTATALSDPTKKVVEVAVARMQSTSMPMPPSGTT